MLRRAAAVAVSVLAGAGATLVTADTALAGTYHTGSCGSVYTSVTPSFGGQPAYLNVSVQTPGTIVSTVNFSLTWNTGTAQGQVPPANHHVPPGSSSWATSVPLVPLRWGQTVQTSTVLAYRLQNISCPIQFNEAHTA